MLTRILLIIVCFRISFTLQSVPKLSENLPRRSQNIGTRFKVSCFVEDGQKPFRFEWRKNDQIIRSDFDQKYQIDSEDDSSRLTIIDLNINDSANYSCTVRNDFGFDSQLTNLIVKGLKLFFYFSHICGA